MNLLELPGDWIGLWGSLIGGLPEPVAELPIFALGWLLVGNIAFGILDGVVARVTGRRPSDNETVTNIVAVAVFGPEVVVMVAVVLGLTLFLLPALIAVYTAYALFAYTVVLFGPRRYTEFWGTYSEASRSERIGILLLLPLMVYMARGFRKSLEDLEVVNVDR